MKILYKYCLIIASVFLLFSCEKDTEDVSRITYYCELDLKGGAVEFVPLGTAYTESGWTASENEEDVSDKVSVSGTVNPQVAGLYRLVYSVSNADGYPTSVDRQIIVYDTTPSVLLSGFYTVSKDSNRNGTTMYGRDFTILIYQTSPGKFYVSDLLGGYYDQRAGYGSRYAMIGNVELASSNTITLIDSKIAGWGDSLSGLAEGSIDPNTKMLKWSAIYAGFSFNVIATPQ